MRTHGEVITNRPPEKYHKACFPSPEAVVTILVAAIGLTLPSGGPKNT
jgi:hypothetical protein